MATVAVYVMRGRWRSEALGKAMAEGCKALGDEVHLREVNQYRKPDTDIAVFYGYTPQLQRVMANYKAQGKHAVYIDLGYWGRRLPGEKLAFHKVSVNDRHPTAYFQNVAHPHERRISQGIHVKPQHDGTHIMVAGMSAKAANVEGFMYLAWEKRAIRELQGAGKQILFRPKPSSSAKVYPHLPGSKFCDPKVSLHGFMRNCHAVATHHSNVAVEAIAEGVRIYCEAGLASPYSAPSLAELEHSPLPDLDREQFMADVAYCQWHPTEMRSGICWRHLKDEGLIPQ